MRSLSESRLRRKGDATLVTPNGLLLAAALLAAMAALAGLVECQLDQQQQQQPQQQLSIESRQQKDNDDLATIKFLEQLDKFYSPMARPRFGRSGLELGSDRRQLGGRLPLSAARQSLGGGGGGSGGSGANGLLEPPTGHYDSSSAALAELLGGVRLLAAGSKYRPSDSSVY